MSATTAGIAWRLQVPPPRGQGLVLLPSRQYVQSKLPTAWASRVGRTGAAQPPSGGTPAPGQAPSGSSRSDVGEDSFAPWGDEFGDKPDGAFRVYCHNVNGLSLAGTGGDLAELCEIIRSKGIDVCGVVEHNLDQTQRSVLSACHNATRRVLHRAKLTLSGSATTMARWYKPGGVLQLTTGPSLGRIQSTTADSMGRWAAQTFRCRQGRSLTVITAYQVCKATWSLLGQATAAAQQISALRTGRHRSLDPRVHFKQDLEQYLKSLAVAGHSLILQGDFNETIGEPGSGIGAVASRASNSKGFCVAMTRNGRVN